jgi:putative transcription factor
MAQLCELCGTKGANKIAVVEGARSVVCDRCALLGELVEVIREEPKWIKKQQTEREKRVVPDLPIDEVVENIGEIVRNAREEQGLKQEELAMKVNESESIIKRIEHGFIPQVSTARKLQKLLRVQLIERVNQEEQEYQGKHHGEGMTLGDFIIKKKD